LTAEHVFVLAQRYRADPEGVSAVIVASTVISTVTLPFLAWPVLESSTLATLLLIAECN
jgi:predicted permease